jgi:DNA-binding response OmpR family regulator
MIEDDESLATMVAEYLEGAGYQTRVAHDARSGLAALAADGHDALILDVMLPDLDGFEVCRRVRAGDQVRDAQLPILMLTARGDETDRIVGLEIGADDYLPKPFNPRELLARLRAILRRRRPAQERPGSVLRFGRLEIDGEAREARIDGEPRPLTSHQFSLLAALAESAGRVLSRDALMQRVRGESLEAFDRSIDTHISRIRSAIEEDPRHPRRILTVRGIGYVFALKQDEDGS